VIVLPQLQEASMGVSLTLQIRNRTTEGIGSLRCFEDVHEEICECLQKVAATAGYRRPPEAL
tara:strand:- start:182 stop:367 length:186 start_codon:yes stop_codon:yes gene_type:complete